MGLTVLYIAFVVVALWLVYEVLFQHRAKLRWRALALAGFLGVVLGVMMRSIPVIGLGAVAFAVGQTYVTLSVKSGFSGGWTARRRGGADDYDDRDERREPSLRVSDLEASDDRDDHDDRAPGPAGYDAPYDTVGTPGYGAPDPAETTAAYAPQPLPDESGSYGGYGGYGAEGTYAGAGTGTGPAGMSANPTAPQPAPQAATAQTGDQGYTYGGYTGYEEQHAYGYDAAAQQQQYAGYTDPYAGAQSYDGTGGYDTTGYGGQQYGQQAYGQEAYGQQAYGQEAYAGDGYGGSTPPGGVWVPPQRSADDPYGGELPQEQQYPYQGNGQSGSGYGGEPYRY